MVHATRRQLIALLGGAAAAWPLAARAQQLAMPVIGYLGANSRAQVPELVDALHRGLMHMGFVEGQNVAIEYRWAESRYERLRDLAADLVRRRVAVISCNSNVTALAVKAATSDIPLVFLVGLDPVAMGLVSAINRPGGNATGVAFLTSALEPKRFELMRELLPQVGLVAALINPDNPNAESHTKDLEVAAHKLGLLLLILRARDVADIEASFATIVRQQAGALLVTPDPVFNAQLHLLVDLAARRSIPAIYPWRDFAAAGGLLSYGNSLTEGVHQVGLYTGRILKGEKPADLPVWIPTKFELAINLKTAKSLGIEIPPTLLARADEVIE